MAQLGRLIASLFLASLAAFAFARAMPGNAVQMAMATWSVPATPETVAALRHEWGLEGSWGAQYARWLVRFVQGDWGRAIRTGRPIWVEFAQRLPISATLGFGGLLTGLVLALPLGFAAAWRPRGAGATALLAINIVTQAVPTFCLGLVVLWLLGVHWHVVRPFSGSVATTYVLPILVVGVHTLAPLARVYQSELESAADQPFFATALGKGRSRLSALATHGHRHALFGVLAAIAPEFGWVIGGTAVAEIVFGLDGISAFVVQSVAVRDPFVLQTYIMVMAIWMAAVGAACAILRRLLDPRLHP
jgi:peptide/nickel transport system permease protein